MAEFSGIFVQQVATGQNVAFTETPVPGSNCVVHRDGSGIVTLRGMTNQCRARYKVVFGGNIAVATGVFPNTGLPLPFISYGVSSLASLYIGIGILLNVGLQQRKLEF